MVVTPLREVVMLCILISRIVVRRNVNALPKKSEKNPLTPLHPFGRVVLVNDIAGATESNPRKYPSEPALTVNDHDR